MSFLRKLLPGNGSATRTRDDPASSHPITVVDMEGRGGEFGQPDAGAVYSQQHRQVVMFRPPITLDQAGQSAPDVDRQLVADYLAGQIGQLAEIDLGPVRIDWKGRKGRFVSAALFMETWQQGFTVILPVQMVSGQVEQIFRLYQEAMALKVREVHKGHQDHTQANALLDAALRQVERLRDDGHPHLTDAEYLFLTTSLRRAKIVNELLPLPIDGQQKVMGQTARVEAADQRQPSGG